MTHESIVTIRHNAYALWSYVAFPSKPLILVAPHRLQVVSLTLVFAQPTSQGKPIQSLECALEEYKFRDVIQFAGA